MALPSKSHRTGGSNRLPEDHNTPIKDQSDIVQLEEEYETKDEIPCAIIGCRQPHKRGRYALLVDGSISRVGNICGRRLLGSDTYTLMQRDFEQRRQRAQRQRFISSPSFDPEGALAALKSWSERIRVMRSVRSEMSLLNPEMLQDIIHATFRDDGRFEILNERTGQYEPVRLRGTQILSEGWHDQFVNARTALLRIARIYKADDLSHDELQRVVRDASDAAQKLRAVAEIVKAFDQFCSSPNREYMGKLFDGRVTIPAPLGSLDMRPIELISPK